MMGPGHALTGLSAGIAYVAATNPPAWQAPIVIGVTALTAGGPLSPDVDHTPAWRILDRLLPDELLGDGGPLQHRGISHWWAVPAASGLALWWFAPAWAWLAASVVLGWTTHLAGDALFGRACPGVRGPGIPLFGWTGHLGLGLDVDGALEHAVVWAWPLVLAWQTAWYLTGTPQPWTLIA
jgi:membrane-bound metal-dependent hydrolase YbcI (DUF457 family)